MTSITCGNCKRTHTSVAEVKYCYSMGTGAVRLTDALDRILPNVQHERPADTYHERPTRDVNDRDWRGNVQKRWTFEDSGIYVGDNTGDIYKAYKALQHDGMLVKRLDPAAQSWNYEGSARKVLGNLDNHHRITAAEAKEYGAIYGVCAICGRTLTDEKSIAAGIGPVCAGKQGW